MHKKVLPLITALSLMTASIPLTAAAAAKNKTDTTQEHDMTAFSEGIPDAESESLTDETESAWGDLIFDTKDINGEPYTQADLPSAKLIIVNFWEPWCGPCVSEMPDLEKLYKTYQDDGLLILGVYSTLQMTEDAKAITEDIGTTYPILQLDDALSGYTTSYVPTTVLFDGNGNLITDEPLIGALPYESWEELVQIFLQE